MTCLPVCRLVSLLFRVMRACFKGGLILGSSGFLHTHSAAWNSWMPCMQQPEMEWNGALV